MAARVAALLGIALSAYFGLVHAFSYAPAGSPSARGINSAIVVMDAVISVHLARGAAARVRGGAALRTGTRRACGWILYLLAGVSLVGVAGLHADYLLARYRGLDSGLAGSLVTIKVLLVAAQVSSLLFLRLAKSRPPSFVAALELFAPGWQDLALLSVVFIPLGNYFSHNSELLSPLGVLEYVALFALPPLVALTLLRFFENSYRAEGMAAPLAASLAFLHYSMPLVCSVLKRPVETLFPVHAALALVLPAGLATSYLLGLPLVAFEHGQRHEHGSARLACGHRGRQRVHPLLSRARLPGQPGPELVPPPG